jgi:hypothetical protein
MSSALEAINNFIDEVNNSKGPPSLIFILIIICSSILITYIYEKIKTKKSYAVIFLEFAISFVLGYIILIIFKGLFSVILGMIGGPFLSIFLYNKYIKDTSDNKPPLYTLDPSIIERGEYVPDKKDVSGNKINVDDIQKPDIYNILDILVLYNYIGANHRRKLYEESIILDTSDIDINKLLRMPVLTEEELREAKNIQKIIEMECRLISREEVLKEIIKAKNKKC